MFHKSLRSSSRDRLQNRRHVKVEANVLTTRNKSEVNGQKEQKQKIKLKL